MASVCRRRVSKFPRLPSVFSDGADRPRERVVAQSLLGRPRQLLNARRNDGYTDGNSTTAAGPVHRFLSNFDRIHLACSPTCNRSVMELCTLLRGQKVRNVRKNSVFRQKDAKDTDEKSTTAAGPVHRFLPNFDRIHLTCTPTCNRSVNELCTLLHGQKVENVRKNSVFRQTDRWEIDHSGRASAPNPPKF